MSSKIKFGLAPLREFPELLGRRYTEAIFYWIHQYLKKEVPKESSISFFKVTENGDAFQYVLTREHLELLGNTKRRRKFAEDLNLMLVYNWKDNSSIIGKLFSTNDPWIREGDWEKEATNILKGLNNDDKEIRTRIVGLEKKLYKESSNFLSLTDFPIKPNRKVVAGIQVLTKKPIKTNRLYKLCEKIKRYSSAIWLAMELDKTQKELIIEAPYIVFLGKYLGKITPEDSFKILS